MALPDDDHPLTGAFAAIDADHEVVGCVRVAPEAPPRDVVRAGDEAGPFWRLRGMATRSDLRNAGIGTQVLGRAIAYVADQGGGLLWCNARVPALGLYRRAGFMEHGAVWEEPEIGPHIIMWRMVVGAIATGSAVETDDLR
jgi:GNAT superfamily N-acetyltransferase